MENVEVGDKLKFISYEGLFNPKKSFTNFSGLTIGNIYTVIKINPEKKGMKNPIISDDERNSISAMWGTFKIMKNPFLINKNT